MNANTYTKGYKAHSTAGGMVTLPDAVYEDQAAYDGEQITVLDSEGEPMLAILRGDLYGLGTSGTGDPVVEPMHMIETLAEAR